MNKVKPVTEPLPEWFTLLQPDALVATKDVASLFGYANPNSVGARVVEGRLPRPDIYMPRNFGHPKPMWRADTLRKEIERRRAD